MKNDVAYCTYLMIIDTKLFKKNLTSFLLLIIVILLFIIYNE